MLPAAPHLSSACEHPHLMKSWLMQLQLDSQPSSASEKTGSLAASSSSPRLAQSAPVVTADFDAPQTPHLSAGGPRERNFFPDVDPASLLNLPLLASEASSGLTSCAEGGGSTHGTSKHITTALSVDSNLSVLRSGTFELSYNDLKERKHKGNGVCYPFISIACGSSDLPATSPACQPPFEDHREQQPAAQPSHRLSRCFLSNINRISHEANTSGKLHICNPRRYTEERDGLPERGCGPWQKDFAELMDSCPLALTQYVVEFDQPVESSEEVLDCENIIKSQIDCTVEGQQWAHFSKRNSLQSSAQETVVPEYILLQEGNSVEANTDSYEEQRAHFLKGNSSQSSVQIKAVPDDTLPEEAKSGELNTDSNEGDLVGRRSCSHCGTLRTPLWRNGPQGPKSLCNACGIRYKKLRRRSGGTESFDLPESPLASLKLKSRPSRSLKRRRDKATYSQFSWEHKNVTETASKVQAIPNRKRSNSKVQGEDATGYSGESCLTSSRQSPSSGLRSPVTTYSEANFIVQDKKSSKSASVEHITLSGFYSVDETEAAVLLLALSRGLANASEICCYLYDTNFAY